jgi:predicted 2-oxoglutarate/Fe(II)-dependent dioxygenase YbiX
MAPSLNISDLTKSGLFQTSGSIPLTDPAANLFFIKPDGTAGHLQFPYPAAESADFTALLESCKPASFGRGQKDVLDPSYRKALCLPAASLALSAPLQLPSSILQEIQRLLQPQAAAVTAALDKLNVYGPDGFFKSHVDTPRAPHMFGSLVVCLPTEFAGGELVLRGPAGVQYTQHWGRSSAESPALQWAAFYSDVEHEIMPVTSGYRCEHDKECRPAKQWLQAATHNSGCTRGEHSPLLVQLAHRANTLSIKHTSQRNAILAVAYYITSCLQFTNNYIATHANRQSPSCWPILLLNYNVSMLLPCLLLLSSLLPCLLLL